MVRGSGRSVFRDCRFLNLDSRFQRVRFRIPQATVSWIADSASNVPWIPEAGLSLYIGRFVVSNLLALGSVSVLLYLALTNRGKLNISCSSFSALAVDDNLPFLERMRSYMLPKHREFITAVRDGPSIKRYGTFRFYTF